MPRHEQLNALAAAGDIDLLFLGDSITEGWRANGKIPWAKRFAPHRAANFGISGDRTEHLLWRIQNGNLAGIDPRAIVLLIGTNNTGRDSAAQIAGGVSAIVREIRARRPSAAILLFAIFPREEQPDHPVRRKIAETNRLLSSLHDGRHVFFIDITDRLAGGDGTLGRDLTPDFLHLAPAAYELWADSIQEHLVPLLP